VIAFDSRGAYGAAWYRLFPADEPGFGFVDERTPELTIAVVPSRRGQGVGAELLDALLAEAKRNGFAAVSLSAEREQTGFYEHHGFATVEDTGAAVTMRRALDDGVKSTRE
jgi:GNAT superfamily N-acetyltransferase